MFSFTVSRAGAISSLAGYGTVVSIVSTAIFSSTCNKSEGADTGYVFKFSATGAHEFFHTSPTWVIGFSTSFIVTVFSLVMSDTFQFFSGGATQSVPQSATSVSGPPLPTGVSGLAPPSGGKPVVLGGSSFALSIINHMLLPKALFGLHPLCSPTVAHVYARLRGMFFVSSRRWGRWIFISGTSS